MLNILVFFFLKIFLQFDLIFCKDVIQKLKFETGTYLRYFLKFSLVAPHVGHTLSFYFRQSGEIDWPQRFKVLPIVLGLVYQAKYVVGRKVKDKRPPRSVIGREPIPQTIDR